jgi:MFS family permease
LLYRIASVEGVMHGLYLLWWVQEKQVSPALVALSLAAGDLVLFAVEWPTGWFADRYGHRRSLIAGSALQVAGMLWCWLGVGVTGLVIGSVLIAVGDGFRSGAQQALLYRTCVALDREDDFQAIEARTNALETAALAILVLGGGLLVHGWGFHVAWFAETLLCAAGLGVAVAMVEPPASHLPEEEDGPSSSRGDVRPLIATMLPTSFLAAFAGMAAFIAQTAPGMTPALVTLLVAGVTLVEAFGSAIAVHVPASQRVQLSLAVAGVLLLGVGLWMPPALWVATPLLSLLTGVAEPLRATLLQRLAPEGARARVASLASACDMAVSTVALPLAGFWRRT